MGLDMYLEGHEYIWSNWKNPEKNIMVEGHRLKGRTIELGYWRKHPDLHGFIVRAFANGIDECQDIPMSEVQILETIEAIKTNRLPLTSGFFFGKSDGSEDEGSIEILENALKWLNKDKGSRSIIYRASW